MSKHHPLLLCWLAALLPLVTTHLSYGVSLWEGVIPGCVPYWADCVSISRTGRHGTAYWLFKALMLPASVLLLVFWLQSRSWLIGQGLAPSRWMLPLALLATLALMTYTLTLGHGSGHFPVVRRAGVAGFIFCTYLVQVSVGAALYQSGHWRRSGSQVLALSTLILAIALLTLVLDVAMGEAYERWEDAFEWWLFLLLNGQLFVILLIRREGERVRSI
ncbi:hypothetical protein KUV89_11495 [Marinobacter hydrocarbonoclasticus]|nr:hypothetical protein [Marinobacter nauticus]